MDITITITNPSVNVLAALAGHAADNAKMMESLDKASTALDVLLDEIARTKAQPDHQDTGLTPAQVDHSSSTTPRTPRCVSPTRRTSTTTWTSARGPLARREVRVRRVVEKIDDEAVNEYKDDSWNVKVIFIRRNDTNKLVSLTCSTSRPAA